MLMMPAFMKSEVSEDDFEALRRLLLKAADFARKDNPKAAGACYLNLGRKLLRREGRKKEALHYYNLAAKWDSAYKTREYYLAEVGGLLFHAERYSLSAEYYGKALRNGGEIRCIALRADALMFAGKYKEALEAFKEYEKIAGKIAGEWYLKMLILEDIVETYKIEKQHRRLSQALQSGFVPVELDITTKEIGEKLLYALSLDALCPLVWFNLGERHTAISQHCEAAGSYMAAGMFMPTVSHSWAKAIISIINCKEYVPLIPELLAVIAFHNLKEGVIKDISRIIEAQPDDKMPKSSKTELINMISSLVREMEKESSGKVAWRVINPDGTYREL
jgi:tetratricopeptide (TPR) repeat protein